LLGGIIGFCHPESVPEAFLAGLKPGDGAPGTSVATSAADSSGGDPIGAAYEGVAGIVPSTDAFVSVALALHAKGGEGWIAVIEEDA
jgi:hypothetical protein